MANGCVLRAMLLYNKKDQKEKEKVDSSATLIV